MKRRTTRAWRRSSPAHRPQTDHGKAVRVGPGEQVDRERRRRSGALGRQTGRVGQEQRLPRAGRQQQRPGRDDGLARGLREVGRYLHGVHACVSQHRLVGDHVTAIREIGHNLPGLDGATCRELLEGLPHGRLNGCFGRRRTVITQYRYTAHDEQYNAQSVNGQRGDVTEKLAESGPTAEFIARVGAEVRRRRTGRRLTVQQLADAAGVSRRMLTLIEQGQANPSLVTVNRVARALGTDFASLTRDTQPDPVAVNEPGSAAGVWSSAAGSRAALQVATQRQPSAELWEWVLQPGDRYDAQPDAAGSEELFLVLNGALTLEVEGLEPVTVKAGGSARLASDRSYVYANHGREPARYVRVVRLG